MTARQLQLLRFIRACILEDGIAPTYLEMAGELGLASRSRIKAIVDRLVDRGDLVRRPRCPRGISLPDVPTVVVRWTEPGGQPQLLVFGEGVRLIAIDESAAGDRLFEVTTRLPLEDLAKLVGSGETIGNRHEPRHAALMARIDAAADGRKHHLRSVQ